jgi:hypothetical protein
MWSGRNRNPFEDRTMMKDLVAKQVGSLSGANATRNECDYQSETQDWSIYHALAQHQREEKWSRREVVASLQQWAEAFSAQFKLCIPKLVLSVDRLPANVYGHFRESHNGFGLEGEIAINSRYLMPQRALWEVLGTLLHEMLHAWQAVHGKPTNRWHHNAEFRAKARELGLNIDAKGVTGYAADSLFKDLLRGFGINVPAEEIAATPQKSRGESKQKKWTCGCTNVRVAVADFKAQCLNCGNIFVRDDSCGRAKQRSEATTVYPLAQRDVVKD